MINRKLFILLVSFNNVIGMKANLVEKNPPLKCWGRFIKCICCCFTSQKIPFLEEEYENIVTPSIETPSNQAASITAQALKKKKRTNTEPSTLLKLTHILKFESNGNNNLDLLYPIIDINGELKHLWHLQNIHKNIVINLSYKKEKYTLKFLEVHNDIIYFSLINDVNATMLIYLDENNGFITQIHLPINQRYIYQNQQYLLHRQKVIVNVEIENKYQYSFPYSNTDYMECASKYTEYKQSL